MCLHSREEILDALRDADHEIGRQYAVVWIESSGGGVRGLQCVSIVNYKEVFEFIRDVEDWHPECKDWTLHLEHVNLQRWARNLPVITIDELAILGKARPSSDQHATS